MAQSLSKVVTPWGYILFVIQVHTRPTESTQDICVRVLEKHQRVDLIRLGLWYKQKQLFLTGMKFLHLNLWSRKSCSSGDVCNQVEQVHAYMKVLINNKLFVLINFFSFVRCMPQ